MSFAIVRSVSSNFWRSLSISSNCEYSLAERSWRCSSCCTSMPGSERLFSLRCCSSCSALSVAGCLLLCGAHSPPPVDCTLSDCSRFVPKILIYVFSFVCLFVGWIITNWPQLCQGVCSSYSSLQTTINFCSR